MVDNISTRSRPSAPQKRAWANGKSAEIHSTRVFFMPDAFSLNLRTEVAQVGVSILGKIFTTLRKPLRLDKVTSSRVLFTRLKLGACSPCCGKWPSIRTGVPLKVTVVIYISFA